MDGNGTLGPTYSFSKCGLNYVTASNKLGQRFVISCCPSTAGVVQPAAFNISGIPGSALIEQAYLWFDISGNGTPVTVTITNPASQTFNLSATLIGNCQDKCWSFPGTYSYRVDITSAISGNGNYMISGIPTSPNQSGNDVDGATMMVIYSDPTVMYKGEIYIYDGCHVVNGGTTTETVGGFNACSASSNAKAFLCIADLQQLGTTLSLNGGPFFSLGSAEDWWNFVEVNTSVVNAQTTSAFSINGTGDCWNLMMDGIYFQTTTCQNCGCINPIALTVTTTSTDATCGQNNGSGTSSATGGTSPYTYNWSNGATTQNVTGLAPGTYIVTITDSSGCGSGSDTIVVGNVGGVTVSATATNVLCSGNTNGTATANPVGQSPYTYVWSNGQTSQTATGLAPGTYTVIVADANGCMDTATATVGSPTAMSGSITSNAVTCFGGTNGSGAVVVSGGTPGYTYSWAPGGQTAQAVSNLSAGTYTVTVTDANGCTFTLNIVISQPQPVSISETVTNVLCYGGSTGSATATASGGTAPYTYAWNTTPPQNTQTATGLTAGTWYVTVTDANFCSSIDTIVVTQPAPPQDTLSITAVFCEGDSMGMLYAPAGFGQYQWYYDTTAVASATADSLQINPAGLGHYTVTWYLNGCVRRTSFDVVVTPQPYFLPDSTANVFTPNGDGLNDIFYPYKSSFYTSSSIDYYAKDFSMLIYDRWGNLIYETTSYKPQWDGQIKGKEASAGVYYWISSYVSRCAPNSPPVVDHGFVHLLR
jgi:gliding motility-associated-like protein